MRAKALFIGAAMLAICASRSGWATTIIDLEFDSLPSKQGWDYEGRGGAVLENKVFTIDSGILRMDGRGLGDTFARYGINNIVKTLPFSLDFSLRIINSDNYPVHESVFSLFAYGSGLGAEVAWSTRRDLGYSRVYFHSASYTAPAIVDTDWHEYHVDVVPSGEASFYLDGSLVAQQPTVDNHYFINMIAFQEDSRQSEVLMEMRRFRFQQPIPEPSTWLLLGAGLLSLAGYAYRRKSYCEPESVYQGPVQRFMTRGAK